MSFVRFCPQARLSACCKCFACSRFIFCLIFVYQPRIDLLQKHRAHKQRQADLATGSLKSFKVEISMVTGLGCQAKLSGFKDVFFSPVPIFKDCLHTASIPDQAVLFRAMCSCDGNLGLMLITSNHNKKSQKPQVHNLCLVEAKSGRTQTTIKTRTVMWLNNWH